MHMAVAGAVLQRDAPLPSGLPRQRLRVGPECVARFARDRERGIARQPLAPVEIGNAERLAEHQAAKAGAVDEQASGDAPLAAERERGDVAALARALDALNQAFNAADAALLGVAAQHPRE